MQPRPEPTESEQQPFVYCPQESSAELIARIRQTRLARTQALQQRRDDRGTSRRLLIQGSLSLSAERWQALELVTALHALGRPLTLQIAVAHQAEFAIICDRADELVVQQAVRGALPGFAVGAAPAFADPPRAVRLVASLQRVARPDIAPLRELTDFARLEPLNRLLSAALPLGDVQLELRYLIRPIGLRRVERANRELTRSTPLFLLSAPEIIGRLLGLSDPRIPRFAEPLQRQLETRLRQPLFELLATVSLAGRDIQQRARTITAAFATAFDSGFGGLQLSPWARSAQPHPLASDWGGQPEGLLVTAAELASFYHWPADELVVPVATLRRPSTIVPIELRGARGLLLGQHRQHSQELPIHLTIPDFRAAPSVILGRTGVGKTTLGHQMLHDLAQASPQTAIVLIDPHGDWVREFARRSVPPARRAQTYLLEFGDTDHPIGLSLFTRPAQVGRDRFIETTYSLLRLIFEQDWSRLPRASDAIFALTATLCELPQATLLHVPKLLTEPVFRRRALARLSDPVALEFWSEYEQLSEGAKLELRRPILSRLRTLYRAAPIRNLLCQTSGFQIGQAIAEGSIVLISLAGEEIQSAANLIGEMLIAQLHLALFASLSLAPGARRQVVLAIDESQRFKGSSLPILLSEARKLGASLLLLTQYLDNWGDALVQAVLGNAGTLVAFSLGLDDSKKLAGSLQPFTAEQIQELDRYEAIVKMRLAGRTLAAFDLQTAPLRGAPAQPVYDQIRRQTRQRFATPRQTVEEQLRSLFQTVSPSPDADDVDEA